MPRWMPIRVFISVLVKLRICSVFCDPLSILGAG
jgi:hypothetical protein